ncbi:glycosyltransferase involved in cell wall biosynthesis [Evansella vedderi]|uniref:Glycosyltransferase involved in cell wall biosynthesis n=1 Tax=Evansella vedderi TaxID=38282 RepID=A0ABT9ZZ43_9BACI|nr:glycosyltransferase family 4 protein [Evansella vedderi]MDQ0255713.1 glycosyltransferase involved in cell wall biosynthesis [Evansella vedderi]
MKVILAAPFYHQPRGNKVTVERISHGLELAGMETEIISSTDKNTYSKPLKADIYHGFHATHFFHFMKNRGEQLEPYILTLTGTDFNHDLFQSEKRENVIQSLNGAKGIHVFSKGAKDTVIKELPHLEEKIFVIPQGVSPFSLNDRLKRKESGTFLFILPAGIRKVKNVPFAIEQLASLKEKYKNIRLWIVGPIIEEEEGKVVQELLNKHSHWVQYIGSYAHKDMGAIYSQGDVILNTSFSEGQSSALLESMALGIPVLVSNNDGNSSIVKHKETGLIYSKAVEFLSFAEALIKEKDLRETLSFNGKKYISEHHSWDKEITSLISIYKNFILERV